MSRVKNADTQYHIAPYTTDGVEPTEWLELAAGYTSIDPDASDNTETFAYYDLDGGEEEIVVNVPQTYSYEGHRFLGDPAQDLIANMEHEEGDARRVWHKVTDADEKVTTGVATVLNIKIRGGNANEFKPITHDIKWVGKPKVEPIVPTQG